MKKKKNRKVVLKASEENIQKFEREQEREQNRYLFGKFIEWSTWILFLLIIFAITGPLFDWGPFRNSPYKEFIIKSFNFLKDNLFLFIFAVFIIYLIFLIMKFLKSKFHKSNE